MNYNRKPLSQILAASLLGAALVPGAHAALEEIIVTAQKRQESMQDVPISVSAITGEVIADRQIVNLSGLNNQLPNVQINSFANSPDSAVFTIRGVGVNDADPYVGTTVSVVVDGAVVGTNTAALISLFDIERLEVLRGPQGTLFGANTTGGVVNVVTKQPTGEYGGEAQLTAGNYGRLDANLAVNFPISDSLSGKISLLHTGHDGYFTNTLDGDDLGEQDITVFRPYLKYETDNYDATLIGEYARMRNGSQTGINISPGDRALGIPGYTDSGEPVFVRGQNRDQPDQNDKDTYGITLSQNFSTGLGDWVAITNYREYDQDLYSDDDATEFVWLQTHREIDHKQFSQEIRTTVDINESLQVLVGGYYFAQEYFLDQRGKLDGFLPGLGQPQTQDQETESYSLFSQLYYDINDQWRLQAGLRLTRENTEAVSTSANTINLSGPATFNDPVIPGSFVRAEGDETWNEVGYKIGLDYQMNEDIMFYGYHAHGFKSGGFTGRIVIAQDIGPYDPEYVDTFEIGMKGDFFDSRLRANLSAFFNLYEDMQIVQNITYPSGANSASIINAAEAETWGFEADLTAAVTDNLTLNVTLAHLQAEFEEFYTPAGAALSGNKLQDSPEWTSSESLTYVIPMEAGEVELFAQHTYTDEKYSYFDNLPITLVDSYNLYNANITYRDSSGRWSLGLYGRNLTDEEYFTQKLDFGVFALAGVGAPREFGADLKFNW